MAKEERTYLGMRPVFIKQFFRGSARSMPVVGPLLEYITSGVLSDEAAKAESVKIHRKLDEILKAHDRQEIDFADVLAGLHIQTDVNEEIRQRLAEVERSLRSNDGSAFPEYFGKAIEKVIGGNEQALTAIQKLSEEHKQQSEEHGQQFEKLDRIDAKVNKLVEHSEVKGAIAKERRADGLIHNLPYGSLGELFKGREDEIGKLEKTFEKQKAAVISQPQTVVGLGGIGKTRLAVEFAWRLLGEGKVKCAFFVVADEKGRLEVGLAGLAATNLLDLPEKELADQGEIAKAVVKNLAGRGDWLLVIDNVDSDEAVSEVRAMLPRLMGGRVLVTSRRKDWPAGLKELAIDKLSEEDAAAYLLKRTEGKRAEKKDDEALARTIARELDGLPLALEIAGAYIIQRRIGFTVYLRDFKEKRQEVLKYHKKEAVDHDKPVLTVWQATEAHLGAGERAILRIASFLAPEAIPTKLLEGQPKIVAMAVKLLKEEGADGEEQDAKKGEDEEPDVRGMLGGLAGWSMIKLDGERFTVHRLVQEAIRAEIPEEELKGWVQVVLWILNNYIPSDPPPYDVRSWHIWDVVWSHVEAATAHGDRLRTANPTTRLMNELALYLKTRARYVAAEPLYKKALVIDEARLGKDHPTVATKLNNLAALYQETNRLAEAEPLYKRALAIDEASLGKDHPGVATDLNNLAQLYQATSRLAEAEPLYKRAMAIDEASFGKDHPDVARDMNNLAGLYYATKRLSEAEPLMKRVVEIIEKLLGTGHPNAATAINNLAGLYYATNRLAEAEPLMKRALAIDEASFGKDHPDVAVDLNNLAMLYNATNRLAEAEPLYERAVDIFRASLGVEHPRTQMVRKNLRILREERGKKK